MSSIGGAKLLSLLLTLAPGLPGRLSTTVLPHRTCGPHPLMSFVLKPHAGVQGRQAQEGH